MHRCALELVGQGGLGYSFDPLIEERPDEYGAALKEFMSVSLISPEFIGLLTTMFRPAVFALSLARFIYVKIQPLLEFVPVGLRRWAVDHIPSTRVQRLKDCSDTITRNASAVLGMKKDAFKAGEETVVKQVGEGKYILSLLRMQNASYFRTDC